MAGGRLSASEAAAVLRSGGVLLLPTDTLPGFHCRADNPEAVARIAGLKGRAPHQALLVLAADLRQAGQVLGVLNRRQRQFCHRCWPGPFSLVLPAAAALPLGVTAGSGTVAVRVPDLPELHDFLLAVGHPLVSTSVNRAGELPALTLEAAEEAFGELVDGAYPCGASPSAHPAAGVPSALIDVTCWPPRVLRPGPQPPPDVAG